MPNVAISTKLITKLANVTISTRLITRMPNVAIFTIRSEKAEYL